MNDNWSRGAAYSVLLLLVSVVFVLLMMKLFRVKVGEIVK
jgi:ABC-type spermidine/putrescine transport system permease subunit I